MISVSKENKHINQKVQDSNSIISDWKDQVTDYHSK